MTDNEINEEIAKACDWTRRIPYPDVEFWEGPMGESREDGTPPDYCNDLNAMHEAEAGLLGHQMIAYQAELSKLTDKNPHVSCWDLIHATARQRAEAFLRAIGKWRNE